MTITEQLDALEAGIEGVETKHLLVSFSGSTGYDLVRSNEKACAVASYMTAADAAHVCGLWNLAPELLRLARLGLEAERGLDSHRTQAVQQFVDAMSDAVPSLNTTPAKREIIKAGLRAVIAAASAPTPPTGGK